MVILEDEDSGRHGGSGADSEVKEKMSNSKFGHHDICCVQESIIVSRFYTTSLDLFFSLVSAVL